MGVVIPIVISLAIEAEPRRQDLANAILSFVFDGLSFVYCLLGLLFLHCSRRHDDVKDHVRIMCKEFDGYFKETPRDDEQGSHHFFPAHTWLMINFMVFVFPGFGCLFMAAAILIAGTKPPLYIYISIGFTWCVFLWSIYS
jgi:hypothetical protein